MAWSSELSVTIMWCDLTPCDFLIWGYVKLKVYASYARTIEVLKTNISNVIREIPFQMCENVMLNWTYWFGYCQKNLADIILKSQFKLIGFPNWLKIFNSLRKNLMCFALKLQLIVEIYLLYTVRLIELWIIDFSSLFNYNWEEVLLLFV